MQLTTEQISAIRALYQVVDTFNDMRETVTHYREQVESLGLRVQMFDYTPLDATVANVFIDIQVTDEMLARKHTKGADEPTKAAVPPFSMESTPDSEEVTSGNPAPRRTLPSETEVLALDDGPDNHPRKSMGKPRGY